MVERAIGFTGSSGLKLSASESGPADGRPVLLLHGGGQTRRAWAATAAALAARGYRAIALDLRGHGESDWEPDGDYQLERFADDLRQVIEQAGGPRPVLVGASLGGLTSIMAAGETPRIPIAALVLVDIVPWLEPKGGEQVVNFMRGTSGGFDTIEEAAEAIAGYLPHRQRPRSADGVKKNLRQHSDGRWYWHWDPAFVSPKSRRWSLEEVNARLTAAMQSIAAPMLLVRGTNSEIVPDSAVERFRETMPSAAIIDIAGAHHMVAGDDNDAFLEALIQFIENEVVVAI